MLFKLKFQLFILKLKDKQTNKQTNKQTTTTTTTTTKNKTENLTGIAQKGNQRAH